MKTSNILVLGGLGAALAVYLARKKFLGIYNDFTTSGNITASLYGVKNLKLSGTDLQLTLILNVINHTATPIYIDSLFTKVIAVDGNGSENDLLTTNPVGTKKIEIPAQNNANVEVHLRAPILSGFFSILSIVKNKSKVFRLEVSPVIAGIALPTIKQTIDLKDILNNN